MATTGPYYSTEYAALFNTLPADVGIHRNKRSHVRMEYFSYTHGSTIGTDGDDIYLCKVPGVCRVVLPLTFIIASENTASAVLSLGWAAYTEVDGTAIAADQDGLLNDWDFSVSSSNQTYFGRLTLASNATTATAEHDPAIISKAFNSRHPVDITATCTGAGFAADATLEGWIAYVI